MKNRRSLAVVIPARSSSRRFPDKPLVSLWGKPLIQNVYEAACRLIHADRIVVATDDTRIQDCVSAFNGEAVLTDRSLRTGSDRVAEVAGTIHADVYLNLQGDEIPLDPQLLMDLVDPFLASDAPMGTLIRPITSHQEFHNPNLVKVVTDRWGRALYFSRSPIPFPRSIPNGTHEARIPLGFAHLGIYIYTRQALLQFSTMGTGRLEAIENLEQLRALEGGILIQTWETTHDSIRIDTPEDLINAQASAITHPLFTADDRGTPQEGMQ